MPTEGSADVAVPWWRVGSRESHSVGSPDGPLVGKLAGAREARLFGKEVCREPGIVGSPYGDSAGASVGKLARIVGLAGRALGISVASLEGSELTWILGGIVWSADGLEVKEGLLGPSEASNCGFAVGKAGMAASGLADGRELGSSLCAVVG
jgi:hypothetical protein